VYCLVRMHVYIHVVLNSPKLFSFVYNNTVIIHMPAAPVIIISTPIKKLRLQLVVFITVRLLCYV
jgi:hypothetical protein